MTSYRLVVVPEPVDVAYFNPAVAQPAELPMGEQVFGPTISSKGGRRYVFLSVWQPYRWLSSMNVYLLPKVAWACYLGSN